MKWPRSRSLAGSARPVDVAAVLDSVDQDDVFIVEDLVDDAVVAAAGGTKTVELADQRLSQPPRVVGDGPEDRLESSLAYLGRQAVEMAQTLSRDLDVVHLLAQT